jgi:hypothetical protein
MYDWLTMVAQAALDDHGTVGGTSALFDAPELGSYTPD